MEIKNIIHLFSHASISLRFFDGMFLAFRAGRFIFAFYCKRTRKRLNEKLLKIVLEMTNYTKHYASTIYQSLTTYSGNFPKVCLKFVWKFSQNFVRRFIRKPIDILPFLLPSPLLKLTND